MGKIQTNAFAVLEKVAEKGVGFLIASGYEFFRNTYLKSIQISFQQADTIEQERIIAKSYSLVGDLYEFLNAPLAAVRAYKIALSFEQSDSLKSHHLVELGRLNSHLGNHQSALRHFGKALELEVNKDEIEDWIEYEETCLEDPPLYSTNNWEWHCGEALAADYPKKVLEYSERLNSIVYHQIRANAFAVLCDLRSFFREWKLLSQADCPVELHYTDFFYIPKEIYNTSDFWSILISMKERYTENCLFLEVDETEHSGKIADAKEHWVHYLEFQKARCDRNLMKLEELQGLYPDWEQLNSALHILKQQQVV